MASPGCRSSRSSGIPSTGVSGTLRTANRTGAMGETLSCTPIVEGPTYVCGRYKVKVLPWPGALVSWISPPSRFASSRLMARPRPVPPYLRLVPASACWNASKMMRCFSGGIPMPLSETANEMTDPALPRIGWPLDHPLFAVEMDNRTPPCSVNLKAFDNRFLRTCCKRFESVTRLRPILGSGSTSKASLRLSAS